MADDDKSDELDIEAEMAAAMAAESAGKPAADDVEAEMAAAMAAESGGGSAATDTDDIAAQMAAEMAAMAKDKGDDDDTLKTDDIEALLDQATDSLAEATTGSAAAQPSAFELNNLTPNEDAAAKEPIDLLGEVELDMRIELGRTVMNLEEVLRLRSGSVVALDKLAGDPVDVFVNGRLIARGEVLVMNDNFCVRVTELLGA